MHPTVQRRGPGIGVGGVLKETKPGPLDLRINDEAYPGCQCGRKESWPKGKRRTMI